MAGTTTIEEDTGQETVTLDSQEAFESSSVNYSSRHRNNMANRAIAAFAFSIVGSAYQMISLYVASFVDRNTSLIYYNYVYEILFFSGLIVIWSASHILEDWKGRITWPSIILVLGIADLSTIIMAYYVQTSPILALVSGPILITFGGILGFSAVRQYSREHARAVLGHA